MGCPRWKVSENPGPRSGKKVEECLSTEDKTEKETGLILGIDFRMDFLWQTGLLLCSHTKPGQSTVVST